MALTSSGAVYSWGRGDCGRLGHGDEDDQLLPKRVEGLQERVCSVAAGESHSLAVTSTGAVYSWGADNCGQLGDGSNEDKLLPTLVAGLHEAGERVCAVAAGAAHAIATTSGGRVWGWGYGEDASLGLELDDHQWAPLQYPALRVAMPHSGCLDSLA